MKKTVVGFLCLLALSGADVAVAQNAPPQKKAVAPLPPPDPAWSKKYSLEYHDPYNGEQNNVSNPNRTPEEIMAWGQEKAVEALSLSPSNYAQKLTDMKTSFTPEGWNGYAAYLKDSNLYSMVKDRLYNAGTITDGEPAILQQGVVSSAYRWLIEIPIIVSISKTDVVTGETKTLGSSRHRLLMQIGRQRTSVTNGSDISVESWKVEDAPKPTK